MFGRKARPPIAPLGMTEIRPDRQPLTAEQLDEFYAGTEQRRSGNVPSVYDMAACCEALMKTHPVQARTTLKHLRWLMRASKDYLHTEWDHPL